MICLLGHKIVIREAKEGDLADLTRFYAEAGGIHVATAKDLNQRLLTNSSHFLVAAADGGKIAAAAYSLIAARRPEIELLNSLEETSSLATQHSQEAAENQGHPGRCFVIISFAVDPGFTHLKVNGRLLPKAIVDAQLKKALEMGFDKVHFVAERDLENYFKKHFHGTRINPYGDWYVSGARKRVAWFERNLKTHPPGT